MLVTADATNFIELSTDCDSDGEFLLLTFHRYDGPPVGYIALHLGPHKQRQKDLIAAITRALKDGYATLPRTGA